MALISLALRTTSATTGTAAWEIRTTSSGKVSVTEIGISLVAATATVLGLGTPTAIGTGTGAVTFLKDDPLDQTPVTIGAVTWGTAAPTGPPTNFYRRWSFPAAIGSGMIFTFPQGLVIPASSSLILWNLVTGSLLDVYAAIEE